MLVYFGRLLITEMPKNTNARIVICPQISLEFCILKIIYSKEIRSEFKAFYAIHCGLAHLKSELQDAMTQSPDGVKRLLDELPNYGHLYELPFQRVCYEVMSMNGQLRKINEIQKAGPLIPGLLAETERVLTDDIYSELDEVMEALSQDDQRKMLALMFACMGNMDSLSMFGCYISDLVRLASTNDEALLRAVLVDSCVIETKVISHRIKDAQVSGDKEFLSELSKSVSKSKARRHQTLDDLRLMIAVVDERCGIESLTDDELLQLFVEDLQLLRTEENDPLAALKWHIRELKKFRRS